jgi:hypothetical protein
VIVLEAGSPVGSLEKGLHGAGKVHEPVAHQEEHAAKPNIFKLEIVNSKNDQYVIHSNLQLFRGKSFTRTRSTLGRTRCQTIHFQIKN